MYDGSLWSLGTLYELLYDYGIKKGLFCNETNKTINLRISMRHLINSF
jgi:hypothetical protein